MMAQKASYLAFVEFYFEMNRSIGIHIETANTNSCGSSNAKDGLTYHTLAKKTRSSCTLQEYGRARGKTREPTQSLEIGKVTR